MSALTMDDPTTARLVLRHIASAERARDYIRAKPFFGRVLSSWLWAIIGKPMAKRMDVQACKFQDQAIWFTGLASKVAASPVSDTLLGGYETIDRLRGFEEDMNSFLDWVKNFPAQFKRDTGIDIGWLADPGGRLVAAALELRDACSDLRGALQAYEASREVIGRAGRRIAANPNELDSELQELSL